MDRFWTTTGRVSLLEALAPCLVQAQPLAQRKPWLVGLGAALAALFLTFVFTVVYAVWCRDSRDSNKEEDVGSVRKEEKEAEGDQGLELQEREVPPNSEGVVSSSK